ncbi:MAG: hypothetical protein KID00_02300 [Clostridium argentinense]|uniref:hypothetical protein n=1 Tax=Clostridium butanoliproducens TaxID=2991837 RepID=UPI001D26BDB0|nr:hypothetical protein [Clostridium butanoliproducens]MBS5822689.1 hypothetical protein [Clostridium argentinense]
MNKKILFITLFLAFFIPSIIYAKSPFTVLVNNKEVPNNGDYLIKDDKVYVRDSALMRDFNINTFYDKEENRLRLYDTNKIELKARCHMFEEFADLYDPKTPDEVAELWAKGIKDRNGVFQYATYNKVLKNEFKKLMESRGSWVTGFSSPWIKDYKIENEEIASSKFKYKIIFKATTSAKDIYIWNAIIEVSKEDGKWRITSLVKDFDIV